MAQTFDIRFARSAGLAGLFEAPANEYRWKGEGRLSIDASGISVAARRGLLTLFVRSKSRRIAASNLLEVYREGNALRLEYSTPKSARAVLPFWASDRNAAAEIVTLLPTHHTVELEDVGTGHSRKYRIDRRMAAWVVVGIVTLGMGARILQRYLAENRVAAGAESIARPAALPAKDSAVGQASPSASDAGTRVSAGAPASRVPVVQPAYEIAEPVHLEPPELPGASEQASPKPVVVPATRAEARPRSSPARPSRDGIVPIVPGDPAYEVARRQFDLFRAEMEKLHSDYVYVRDSDTAEPLEDFEARWLSVTSRIYNTEEFMGIELMGLREIELAISRSWRDYLSIRAAGLRTGNKALLDLSLAHLAFTERLESLFPQYVR